MDSINRRDWDTAAWWLHGISEEEVQMDSPQDCRAPNSTALHLAAWANERNPPWWIGQFYQSLCRKVWNV